MGILTPSLSRINQKIKTQNSKLSPPASPPTQPDHVFPQGERNSKDFFAYDKTIERRQQEKVFTVRKTMFLVLVIAMVVGSGFAKSPGSNSPPEGLNELTKEKGGRFKTTLIHPDADFSKYDKLLPTQVRLEFREQSSNQGGASTGSLTRKQSKPSTAPTAEDKMRLAEIINESLLDELGRSEAFQVVHEAGPGTLVLRAAVTNLVCECPAESSAQDKDPEPVSAQGNIVFDLVDAESGVIQARIGERRKCRREDGSVAPDEIEPRWIDVCTWAKDAASDLRDELERVRSENGDARNGNGA